MGRDPGYAAAVYHVEGEGGRGARVKGRESGRKNFDNKDDDGNDDNEAKKHILDDNNYYQRPFVVARVLTLLLLSLSTLL